MAKYKSPHDYHLDGILHFKNARKKTWLEQQENTSKVTKRKKQKSHIDNHWEDVLRDTWS